ncbi:MAG: response regulator [Verrucomicrobiota bacterium]|nr:response regulator [Verrucomicrobiota bacterium]
MADRHKILLLDDDQDLLDLYREMLSQLSLSPEVHTASSGARAMALLESEPFNVLISDLKMPKMDGLQVLTLVRKKFPNLRTVVMSAVTDEQFRARAYALGIDLYLEKPQSAKELSFFVECIESLLDKEVSGGFRGVQSKSLMDLIQIECLSQNSSVLKITNGVLEGRIWIQSGDVIDAEAEDLTGEAAFQKIAGWKTGSFETLPADPSRPRRIMSSYQGLLLETAQAMDEAESGKNSAVSTNGEAPGEKNPLIELGRIPDLEFAVPAQMDSGKSLGQWGIENPDQVSAWCADTFKKCNEMGERFQWGDLKSFEGTGTQRHMSILPHEQTLLCVGFKKTLSREQVRESMKKALSKWIS